MIIMIIIMIILYKRCMYMFFGVRKNCNSRTKNATVQNLRVSLAHSTRILWHVDPLPGNDCETNKETTAFARHRSARNDACTVGSSVFCGVLSESISRD
jgi:hypothetical protein